MNHQPECELDRQLDELRALTRGTTNGLVDTGIARVAMVQGAIPEHELSAVYEPMINLILQGSKSMTVGERTLHFDPATYFVMSVDLPAAGQVRPAANGEPYLAVALMLRPAILATLLADLPEAAGAELTLASVPRSQAAGFSVAAMTTELMGAWLRMLRLMHKPADIAALAPVYEREILYRVLCGPHGAMLRAIATPDSAMARVSAAIAWIRRDYASPLRVEQMADKAAMSVSAFHRHFKAVTALSPLQYQKRIRLLRARTLLVSGGASVSHAAFDVGYESATQFSREYARAFGLPPARDVARIQSAVRR